MLTSYHDDDYEFFVYSIADIKAELGLTPHTRTGLLEKLISVLEEERRISVLDWRIKNHDGNFEWLRMLTPSDSMVLISEYYRKLPDKKKNKVKDTAEDLLKLIARRNILKDT